MHSRALALIAIGLGLVLSACGGGQSYTPCERDDECAASEVCLASECKPATSCAEDADCSGGRVCLAGFCKTAGCNQDSDCAASEHCEDHVCVDGPRCTCLTDADCAPTDYCKDGCTCELREVTPCALDAECAAGELCLDATCQLPPSCTQDADCPASTVCDGSRCVRPCAQDADCPQIHTCVQGHCLQQCIADSNCQGGLICEGNVCVEPECSSDADCSGNLIRCHTGRCQPYTPCADDSDCDPTFECLQSICEERPRCSIDDNCVDLGLPNHACEDGHCMPVPPCADEADCPADRDCIAGLCLPHVCRGPADCSVDQICVAGECRDPDPGATVYQVLILNPGGPIHQGQSIQLMAIALTQAGNELPGVSLDWSSSEPGRVAVDADGLATGGAEAGPASIIATAVTANIDSDPLLLTNMLDAQADSLQVTVVSALDRAPIEGATVVVMDGGASETVTTDAAGRASFAAPAATADVHVFADGFNYLSVIGTSSLDLLLPLAERSARAAVGGFTGQMTFQGIGALSMGVAGASLAGNLVDLDFAKLMGQIFNVQIPQVGTIPLPAQMVASLSFMGQDFALKETYYVAGQNGLRTGWCLGGRVDAQVLYDLAGGGVTIEDVVVGLLPYFSLLNHGVRPVVDVYPYPLVTDSNDIDADNDFAELRPDWEAMLDLDLAPTTPQNLAVEVRLPALPSHAGQPMRTAIYVSGALTPLGFTPLGMSAGQDESGQLAPMVMKMAPAYGGLQVGGYAVLVLGFPQTAQNEMATDLTALLRVVPQLPALVDFEAEFLAFPEDATYDPLDHSLVASEVAGADLYRSTLQSDEGGWEIYLAGSGTIVYDLPPPPAGMPDLASGATVTLDPIRLIPGMGFDDLVTFNGDDLDSINRLAVAFARYQLP
jgi:hypothetical protein